MAEPYRDPDPNAPENPPDAVVNEDVRRYALLTYLPPLVLFFAGVAVLLAYWSRTPPATEREGARAEPRAEGTAGRPSSPREEVEYRGGAAITRLDDVIEGGGRGTIGRPVDLREVIVERVESPTLFWIKDGDARVAVTPPPGSASVQAGQSVNVTGTVEGTVDSIRIRASRVSASR